jgi:CubicO group peptidase (beta-lactamase class C family)
MTVSEVLPEFVGRMRSERSRGEHLYSNGGYIVAGAMLEALTGQTWETLMEQELFQPLGITTAGFGAPGTSAVRDQPWGHLRSGGTWTPLSPGPGADNPAAIGPAGTVHIALSDITLYRRHSVARRVWRHLVLLRCSTVCPDSGTGLP